MVNQRIFRLRPGRRIRLAPKRSRMAKNSAAGSAGRTAGKIDLATLGAGPAP